jgi:hypothetical protein
MHYLGAKQVQPVSEIENPPFYAGLRTVKTVQIWLLQGRLQIRTAIKSGCCKEDFRLELCSTSVI